MTLCDFIRWKEWNDTPCNELQEYIEKNKICEENINQLNNWRDEELKKYNEQVELNLNLSKELDFCSLKLSEAEEKLQKLTIPNPEIEYWNNKYPKKTILYMGRNFGKTSTMIPIDVKLMITPQDAVIKSIVEEAELEIENPETDVPKIYSWLHQYYKYEYDKNSMGLVEHWKFPFETVYALGEGKGSDCDDFALLQSSLYIAAGMPSWKVRCVAGLTPGGEGHLTVGVYSEVTKDFRHLNSTYYGGKSLPKTLAEYKRSGDPTDPLNITDVWFSMNNEDSWSSFLTTNAKQSFNKQEIFKII